MWPESIAVLWTGQYSTCRTVIKWPGINWPEGHRHLVQVPASNFTDSDWNKLQVTYYHQIRTIGIRPPINQILTNLGRFVFACISYRKTELFYLTINASIMHIFYMDNMQASLQWYSKYVIDIDLCWCNFSTHSIQTWIHVKTLWHTLLIL